MNENGVESSFVSLSPGQNVRLLSDRGDHMQGSPQVKSERLPSPPEDSDSVEHDFTTSPTASKDGSFPLFIPIDTVPSIPSEFLSLTNPSIDEDTPAAAALRANAEVHVNAAAKLARKIHVQTVRNIVKKATKRGMGNKRGKPPRIPPKQQVSDDGEIYIVEEENEESSNSSDDSSQEKDKNQGPSSYIVEKDRTIIFDNVEQLPSEVLAATMETGKKCKLQYSHYRIAMHGNSLNPTTTSLVLAFADPHDIISNQRWRRRKNRGANKENRKSYVKGKVSFVITCLKRL
jgi:hypothetical protein